MSRTRYTHRAHQMRSMPAAYPLVVRRGMRPLGYGDDTEDQAAIDAYKPPTMPSGGWPCLYVGVTGQQDAIKYAAYRIKQSDTTDNWWNGEGSGSSTDGDRGAVRSAFFDGAYTSAFKAAVLSLQKYNKYDYKDGVIGPETWRKIGTSGDKGANCPAPASSSSYVPSGGGGAGGKKAASGGGARGSGGSITDKAWFWPVAILVPTAAVIGGILFWPKKKAQ